MIEKICSKCKNSKSITRFGKSIKYKSGYRCSCKDCEAAHKRKYIRNNPEKRKIWQDRANARRKDSKRLLRLNRINEAREEERKYAKNWRESLSEEEYRNWLERKKVWYNNRRARELRAPGDGVSKKD